MELPASAGIDGRLRSAYNGAATLLDIVSM
jgi:hypothetical protein